MLTERGPGQDAHWSTRSVAAGTVMSQAAISRIWRAYGPKPHVTPTRKLGSDPEFIGKADDIWAFTSARRTAARVHVVRSTASILAHRRRIPVEGLGMRAAGGAADDH